MANSRIVDRLTYVYYTGQEGSEANGPNCHKCMNDLFHEGKLYDIQMVFINTPSGLVPVTPIFTYGVAAPFSLTSFAEDFLVTRCVQCAEKAIRLQMSEAAKQDGGQGTIINTQQLIKTEYVPEAIHVISATLTTQPAAPLTNTDSTAEFSSDQLGNHMEVESNSESQRKNSKQRTLSPQIRSPHLTSRSRGPGPTSRNGSPRPKSGSRSLDRKTSESRECRRESHSRKHRDRKKDRERHGKKRKRSRSRSRNRKTDRKNGSPSRTNKEKCKEDFSDDDDDLPFLYGRPVKEVSDPISKKDTSPADWLFEMSETVLEESVMPRYVRRLARSYFVNQDVIVCNCCNLIFCSTQGISLVYHLLGKQHFENVAKAGLVFSHSKDFEKLVNFSNGTRAATAIRSTRIPFVFKSRCLDNGICLKTLANYLNCLKRLELINDDFSKYLEYVYPNLKGINCCSICKLVIPLGQGADGYLKHFLSSKHIAKAQKKNWNIGADFGRFVSHLYSYLKRNDRQEELGSLFTKLQLAAK